MCNWNKTSIHAVFKHIDSEFFTKLSTEKKNKSISHNEN